MSAYQQNTGTYEFTNSVPVLKKVDGSWIRIDMKKVENINAVDLRQKNILV